MTEQRLGGFSDIARDLGLSYPTNADNDKRYPARQVVYMWWIRRDRNGFPNVVRTGDNGRKLFDLDAVRTWYAGYVPSSGGRPPKPKE